MGHIGYWCQNCECNPKLTKHFLLLTSDLLCKVCVRNNSAFSGTESTRGCLSTPSRDEEPNTKQQRWARTNIVVVVVVAMRDFVASHKPLRVHSKLTISTTSSSSIWILYCSMFLFVCHHMYSAVNILCTHTQRKRPNLTKCRPEDQVKCICLAMTPRKHGNLVGNIYIWMDSCCFLWAATRDIVMMVANTTQKEDSTRWVSVGVKNSDE